MLLKTPGSAFEVAPIRTSWLEPAGRRSGASRMHLAVDEGVFEGGRYGRSGDTVEGIVVPAVRTRLWPKRCAFSGQRTCALQRGRGLWAG
jgi:hypothetical protein